MKNVMFVLALLVLAVPVWAATDVVITCEQIAAGEPEVAIGYIKTGDGHVRAFALNIVVTAQVGTPLILDVNCVNADYYIYPGSIQIDENGNVTDDGDCACDAGQYPIDTLPGPPASNGVTIEMGSLYDDVPPLDDPCHQTPPSDGGTLLILTVDSDSCITVTENILRGGVVLEDPQATVTLDLPEGDDCCVTGLACFPSADPMYANWVTVGKPGSWCCDYQALGDTNGDGWINAIDLLWCFRPAYNTQHGVDPAYDSDADFNHDKWVNALDLLWFFRPNYNTNPGPGYDCPHD